MAGVPRPARRLLAAVLVGAAGLGGCAAPDRPVAATGPGAAVGTTPDSGPPASYQVRLTGLDRDLGAALDRVRRAREPDTLAQATIDAAGVSGAAGERMRADPGDPAVAAANTALADGLTQFARELGFLSQRVYEHEVCTGAVALGVIAAAPSMPALRAVAGGLALPGTDGRTYRWGVSLPSERSDPTGPPPENGQLLADRRDRRGDGVLEVRNEGADTAVLVLARDDAALLSVAVAPARSTVVNGVPDGTYQLAYTSGRDWDPGAGAFGRGCRFRRFTAPTPFRTEQTGAGVGYTVQTVVIRAGPADAASADIPPSRLPG